MTDLTLNEYKDISEDALKSIIIEEERKMSGACHRDQAAIEKTHLLCIFVIVRKIFGKACRH